MAQAGKCGSWARTTNDIRVGTALDPSHQAEEMGLSPVGQGHPESLEQNVVMSSELYSRTFSDPRCTVSAVKEGTLLLPPHAHKYAKRREGGQAFQAENMGSTVKDTWV